MIAYYIIILWVLGALGLVMAVGILLGSAQLNSHLIRWRIRSRYGNRSPLTKDDFVLFLEEKGFSAALISQVYDEVYKIVPKGKFSMYPSDNLIQDYHLDKDYLEHLTLELFRKVHQRSPQGQEWNQLRKLKPLVTFEKMLNFAQQS
jgi:hypothetical protein